MDKNSFRDLSGERFHRLVVTSYAGRLGSGNHHWNCRCDCGNEKTLRDYHLLQGLVKSCGCYRAERGRAVAITGATAVVKTHGMHGTATHRSWMAMKRRCNLRHATPSPYAAQGITVCERWAESFEAFLADMGERPSEAHSIDRIDFTRAYEPGNCRWATDLEQGANKRNNRWIEFRGERKHLLEWAREFNIGVSTLWLRLKLGWSIEDALCRPTANRRPRQ